MMLEKIQQKMEGPAMKVVLFIIIIFFIFAGYFSANLFAPDAGEVAEVDGVSITNAEIDNVISRQRRQNPNFDQLYPTEASKALLREQVREQLINERVYVNSINKAGLTASKAQVEEQIRSMPEFQVNGVYDAERAKTLLAQNNISNSRMYAMAKDQITRDQFSQGITQSGFTLDKEIETFYRIQEQTRDARIVRIPKAKFSEGISIGESEVQAYYDERKLEFEQSEKVNLDYIVLSKAKLTEQMLAEVTDEQVAAYYNDENNKGEFVAPDKIQVAHILIANDQTDARQKAEDLLTQIQSGADFAELAKTHSSDTFSGQQGGLLDATDATEGNSGWVPEFEAAALALTEAGQLSDVVESQFGFHILKLIERTAGEVQSMEEVAQGIKDIIADEKAEAAFFKKQALLNDAIFSTESIADLAKTAELEFKNSGFFERAAAADELANPALLEQAFSAENIQSKDISDEIKLGDQSIAFIAVKEYQAAGIKPLDEVKAQITSLLTEQKAVENTKAFAESIKTALDESNKTVDLLATKDLAWAESATFTNRDASLAPELATVLFSQKAPGDKTEVTIEEIAGGDYVVVELRKVNYPDLAKLDDAKKQQYKLQLNYLNSQADFQALLKELREKSEIR